MINNLPHEQIYLKRLCALYCSIEASASATSGGTAEPQTVRPRRFPCSPRHLLLVPASSSPRCHRSLGAGCICHFSESPAPGLTQPSPHLCCESPHCHLLREATGKDDARLTTPGHRLGSILSVVNREFGFVAAKTVSCFASLSWAYLHLSFLF